MVLLHRCPMMSRLLAANEVRAGRFAIRVSGCASLLFAILAVPITAQIPDEFQNLRILPTDISRDSLLGIMRDFSFALGVRCQYCHVGGDGISFEGVEFHNDDDPDKRKARFMLRLVANLNNQVLPLIPERDDPPRQIECKTCHRGLAKPVLLRNVLSSALDRHGADSAVATYRRLRESSGMAGVYDFGEWETNTLAEELAAQSRFRDAIAIYELNADFYPRSSAIAGSLARLYEQVADTAAAIRSYERVLELRPNNQRAVERLRVLRGR